MKEAAPTWRPRSDRHRGILQTYCSALATLLNVPFTAVPVACTATMIATEIPAAMRPYSMAVAPELSLKKRITSLFILVSLEHSTCTRKLCSATLSSDSNQHLNFY